ncbi:MAG: protein TolR [Rhodospirillaceae bacterium]|jgi:biopolymer transport protein TolR|nr:protein TolR [Rhodospirillaceae bacterium]
MRSTNCNGGQYGSRRSFRPMSDINVTPMVDVMLVLLVIFMITAPLLTTGVPVDLPKTSAEQIKGDDQTINITVDAKGHIFLQKTEVQLNELTTRLKAITTIKSDNRIFVRGDSNINYGRVMEIIGELSSAGFSHIALITQPITTKESH